MADDIQSFFARNDWLNRKLSDMTAYEFLQAAVEANRINLSAIQGQSGGGEISQLDFSDAAGTAAMTATGVNSISIEVATPRGDLFRDIYVNIPRASDGGVVSEQMKGTLEFFNGTALIGTLPVSLDGSQKSVKPVGTFAGERPLTYSTAFGWPSSNAYNQTNKVGENAPGMSNALMVYSRSSGGIARLYIPPSLTIRCNFTRCRLSMNNWRVDGAGSSTGNESLLLYLGILSRAQ